MAARSDFRSLISQTDKGKVLLFCDPGTNKRSLYYTIYEGRDPSSESTLSHAP